MSWSRQLGPQAKTHLREIVGKWAYYDNEIDPEHMLTESTLEQVACQSQFETAKQAALQIAEAVPGPFISISLSGHANGVGWQEKGGMANDTITVIVYQVIKP